MNIEEATDLKQFWASHIESWKQSELSQSAYCQANELPVHRFGYWKRKLESAQAVNGFVQLHPVTETQSLSLQLPNHIRIEGITAGNLHLAKQLSGLLR